MGKESRFEELFLPYLDAAYNLAHWMVGRDQDAADIVQEAYARALQRFPEFRGDNPRAWLLTIVRNTADTWLTKPRQGKGANSMGRKACPSAFENRALGIVPRKTTTVIRGGLDSAPSRVS